MEDEYDEFNMDPYDAIYALLGTEDRIIDPDMWIK